MKEQLKAKGWEIRDIAGLEIPYRKVGDWTIEWDGRFVAWGPKKTRVFYNRDLNAFSVMSLEPEGEMIPAAVVGELVLLSEMTDAKD